MIFMKEYELKYSTKIWLIVFAYTMLIAFLIQLVLLPYVFPSWHAGGGLLDSSLDSIGHHQHAVDLYEKIRMNGFQAWAMTPAKSPSDLLALLYVLTVPKPWTLIPINAALHATSALLLCLMIQNFINDRKKAFWCVLPFTLYITPAAWYAQIHKNGFVFAGFLLILYGWIEIAKVGETPGWKIYRRALAHIFCGIVLMWIVRPFMVELSQLISIINAVFLTALLSRPFLRDLANIEISLTRFINAVFLTVLSFLLAMYSCVFKTRATLKERLLGDLENIKIPVMASSHFNSCKRLLSTAETKVFNFNKFLMYKFIKLLVIWVISIVVFSVSINILQKMTREPGGKIPWIDIIPKFEIPRVEIPRVEIPRVEIPRAEIPRVYRNSFKGLIEFIGNKIGNKIDEFIGFIGNKINEFIEFTGNVITYPSRFLNVVITQLEEKRDVLIYYRDGFRLGGGKSVVDGQIQLKDFTDIFFYFPRLLEVAFLSPFPYQWFEEGSYSSATAQRKIVGIEMMGIYFFLSFLPYAIWRWRRKVELWVFLIFNFTSLLFHAFLVLNIGTLQRQRYGYLMALVALGIAGFIDVIQKIKK